MFPSKPAKAATHEPFRSHDEPETMGDVSIAPSDSRNGESLREKWSGS